MQKPHVLLVSLLSGVFLSTAARGQAAVDEVDPFIGTAEHGHVYPGATVPFGMIQLSPDTREGSWDGSSGYHYSDKTILGFSHNHLSGTGVGDLGYVLLMPTVGELKMSPGKSPSDGFQASFSHEQETARPGYYRVRLNEPQIDVELTATARVGLHRYTFPASEQAHIILDLVHGISSAATDATITMENDHCVSGYRRAGGWGGDKVFYFVVEFSKPFISSGVEVNGTLGNDREAKNRRLRAHLDFKTAAREQILARVALSTVSVEGAKKNLRAEVDGWDFDNVAAAARKQWENALAPLRIESRDNHVRKMFYTAAYHALLAPTLLSDVDGQVRGPDGKVHAVAFDYYTELSLWDTFRAENPLLTLIQPARVNDIIKTMLAHYQFYGRNVLPIWANAGKETYCMIGNHAIPIMAEAWAKGFRDWDASAALEAMVASVNSTRDFQDKYRQLGYVPARPSSDPQEQRNPNRQSASRTLEYAYDDACIARFAQMLGKGEVAATFARRSENWRNLLDAETGFIRGKLEDGTWFTPFDPLAIDFENYTEANSWHYTFFVPQNIPALIQAMGGDTAFAAKLDACFDSPDKMPKQLSDVTGLIGMYAHGNEPCHHMAYLYNFAGLPAKTQARSRQIAALYKDTPGGLCGNDDCGQMSAWYMFNAVGFYPVDPVSCTYVIGSPLVDKAVLTLDPRHYSGKTFTVIARNNSAASMYIQSATLNGQPLTRTWLKHSEIAQGGELVLEMGATPNPSWGTAPANRPGAGM